MARGKNTEPEKQVEAMAIWLSGCTITETAERIGVPYETVRDWTYGELFAKYRHLKKGIHEAQVWTLLSKLIADLQRMTAYVSQPEYLEKQNARDVAILAGVLYDKTFRLLAAKGEADAETERILSELGVGAEPDDIVPPASPDWDSAADTSETGTRATFKVAAVD